MVDAILRAAGGPARVGIGLSYRAAGSGGAPAWSEARLAAFIDDLAARRVQELVSAGRGHGIQ